MYDERAAIISLEKRVWPGGAVCAHCGEMTRLGRLNGLSTPVGAWKCYGCRKPFTVRHGTIFHNSHVPTHVWLQALYLLTATDQKIGSQKLAHVLGVSVRTAWLLKVKIATALDAEESGSDDPMLWRPSEPVFLDPAQDEEAETQPGAAICAARYKRFLAAIDGLATAKTDRLFLEALCRLLPSPVAPAIGPAGFLAEQQLELGLFSDPSNQMGRGFAP
jgi:transposase-like protein